MGSGRALSSSLVEESHVAQPLSYRLLRDGFHALAFSATISDQTMVGAVPGALVTRIAGSDEFHVTHRVQRGTRPLHITAVPSGNIYWGEYFDNRERAEVHIYVSTDRGRTWQIAYTFPAGSIRHVHNIVYDRWGDCLWILTGDEGAECKVLRAPAICARWRWCWQGTSKPAPWLRSQPKTDCIFRPTRLSRRTTCIGWIEQATSSRSAISPVLRSSVAGLAKQCSFRRWSSPAL